jgi:cytochrome c oxidase assembly protein subunit 15
MGLFPANFPSFVEWAHRLVAMIAGFVILGTAIVAYRGDHERRIVVASAIAVLVLPVQVLLGANNVFNYGIAAQILHHGAAQIIFASLVATTAWAYVENDGEGGGNVGETRDTGTVPGGD